MDYVYLHEKWAKINSKLIPETYLTNLYYGDKSCANTVNEKKTELNDEKDTLVGVQLFELILVILMFLLIK